MNIVFIKPNMIAGLPGDAMEPLVFAILAALTPDEIDCILFDERIEPIDFEAPADLVAMTVDTFSAKRAYQIAARYRRRGIPVVMGGFHPSLCPEEVSAHADSVVVGDAEDTWPALLDDAQSGTLKPIYESACEEFGDAAPDRSVFAGKRYNPIQLVEYNRGCRFNCDFCSIRAMYKRKLRRRPVETVLSEVEREDKRHLLFTDDNLYTDAESLSGLLDGLDHKKRHWSCQISADVVRQPALVARMAASGCASVTIGFESLSNANLAQMRKSWMQTTPRDVIRCFQHHGILVYGTFVIGYDDDQPDAFDRLVAFAIEANLFLTNFNPLTPTPGTPLYERLQSENRLLYDRWWLDPDYRYGDCVFRPFGMSAAAIRDGCFRARKQFNQWRSLLSRFPGVPYRKLRVYQTALFVAANLVSRREIYRKQGHSLGDIRDEQKKECVCM